MLNWPTFLYHMVIALHINHLTLIMDLNFFMYVHPSGVWDKHSHLVHILVVYSQSFTFSLLLNFTYFHEL